MNLQEYVRRYAVYVAGLYVLGLSTAMIIQAGLGTSPPSSWTYVMSCYTPLSVGTYTFFINVAFMVVQCLILRHHGLRSEAVNILLQLPFAFLFGLFIDLNALWVNLIPLSDYGLRFVFLIAGIVVQSVGVLLEVKASVSMLSMDATVNYACRRWHLNFGKTKVWFDCSLVLLAVVFATGFALSRNESIASAVFSAVREGTILAALLCGLLVDWMSPFTASLERWMERNNK